MSYRPSPQNGVGAAVSATESSKPPPTIDKLLADAAEQGLPPPTVETLIRALSCPCASLDGSAYSSDPFVTGDLAGGQDLSQTACLVHVPSLGPILSRVGLDYMLANLAIPANTSLRQLDEGMCRHLDWRLKYLHEFGDGIVCDTLMRFVEDAKWLWLELCAPEDEKRAASFQTSNHAGATCSSWSHGRKGRKSGIITTPEGFACQRALTQLESYRTSVVPLDRLPRTRADDAGSVLTSSTPSKTGNTTSFCSSARPTSCRSSSFRSTHPTRRCPTCSLAANRVPFLHPQSHFPSSAFLTGEQARPCTTCFRASRVDSPSQRFQIASLPLLFGDRVPYNATLASHGTSLVHLTFAVKQPALVARAEERIRKDLLKELRRIKYSPARRSKDKKHKSLLLSAVLPASQRYRLVTFAELQETESILVAFVTPDHQLVSFHRLLPYPSPPSEDDAPSSLPTPPKTPPLSLPAQDAGTVSLTKLLLISSEPADGGHQGNVYRAYCSGSPFPLVIKYTRFHERRRQYWEKPHELTDEIDFYRAYGDQLADEKLAPRFVGGWMTGRTESPHMAGSPTAVMILEDCGESLEGKAWEDVDIDRNGRRAIYALVQRLHASVGLRHRNLKPHNCLWRPSLGYDSLRLINWTSSTEHDERDLCRIVKTPEGSEADEEEGESCESQEGQVEDSVDDDDDDEEDEAEEEEELRCRELEWLWTDLGLEDG
ncbi:hypothetical protein AAT19DRAFT_11314 [Rhodotorula toruloides]|uniref:Protein kinase domain-containing protein n=1 Tax=Rhodotorula toruloides TaxID=5286 RepID=A0A2S9ZXS4_RHOTO|nr:hypothetical protein AAT19DRAFT_11314 [Rhodotorula toruloides]